MEVLDFVAKNKLFPWKPLVLKPLGDIQYGSSACDVDRLKREVSEALDKGAWFIGLGDYCDVGSPSNRKEWARTKEGMYDSFREAIDEKMAEHEDGLFKILEPTKGRWLGLLSGHHYWEYEDGTNTDINLARRLETKHLGDCAIIRIRFNDKNGHSASCVIWAHHGAGSGVSVGAPLNRLERVIQWVEADLYLMGHQHKRVEAPIPRLYLSQGKEPKLIARERRLVCTGSFLKGYMQGSTTRSGIASGTYVEKKMLTPVALGSPTITITPTRVWRSNLAFYEVNIDVTS